MSVLERVAFFLKLNDEQPNIELAGALAAADDARFREILETRLPDLTAPQRKRIEKLLVKIKKGSL